MDLDPDLALALLDLKHAGKKLLLITNSEWFYTKAMMSYCFDRYLPGGMTCRDLFDLVIVGAQSPRSSPPGSPSSRSSTTTACSRPVVGPIHEGKAYLGGNAAARRAEPRLLAGDDILYVGDPHLRRRERVEERAPLADCPHPPGARGRGRRRRGPPGEEARLAELMAEKEQLDALGCQIRLDLQRLQAAMVPRWRRPPRSSRRPSPRCARSSSSSIEKIAPLAAAVASTPNERWGSLLYAGNDKSHLARQVERSADIYTSRVSNFLFRTPFAYLRSQRGTLPHDPAARPGPDNRGGDVP